MPFFTLFATIKVSKYRNRSHFKSLFNELLVNLKRTDNSHPIVMS